MSYIHSKGLIHIQLLSLLADKVSEHGYNIVRWLRMEKMLRRLWHLFEKVKENNTELNELMTGEEFKCDCVFSRHS